MTKKNKRILIISAVVIGLLYFITLGMGLSQDDEADSMDDATPAWTKIMGTLMSPFAPRVDASKLRCSGSSTSLSAPLTLTSNKSCEITFNKASLAGDEDFWKLTVQASSKKTGADIPVYIKSKFTDEAHEKSPPGDDCVKSAPSKFGLEIEYSGADEKGINDKHTCWLQQDSSSASFTVLEQGSKLKLVCVKCADNNQSIKVTLE